jgi:two-component system sensor histidine kinase SenX3
VVEVVVSDQGLGIATAEQDRIFERFYRIDPARSRATGGTGLGLSIVKHVAANHGGEVTLWSLPGQGSTFTLRLPETQQPPVRTSVDADESAQPAAEAETGAEPARPTEPDHPDEPGLSHTVRPELRGATP